MRIKMQPLLDLMQRGILVVDTKDVQVCGFGAWGILGIIVQKHKSSY